MSGTSHFTLPTDPGYTAHRDMEKRRRETLEWLKARERELRFVGDAPAVAPDNPRQPAQH